MEDEKSEKDAYEMHINLRRGFRMGLGCVQLSDKPLD